MAAPERYLMYLTGQHPRPPITPSSVSPITHVALAFMQSSLFNKKDPKPNRTDWEQGLFTTVEEARKMFAPGTKILVAIGGWGDTKGFEEATRTEEERRIWAENVAEMVGGTRADGVDIDWEYPGGNGEDYKQTPNSQKSWQIPAYPLLLSAVRTALGPSKLISAAVPGLPRDMLAFTPTTLPAILRSIDFLNIMTYDLMNRRDNITKHHTGLALSLQAVDAYLQAGLPPAKANLGFAFYVKWFKTDAANGGCAENPIGCKTVLMEDPETGADLGQSGAFSWHDKVPEELAASFERAMANGMYDRYDPSKSDDYSRGGGRGHYYWDAEENIWWTWDTPEAIKEKMRPFMLGRGLGGAFAWGLGEDGPEFKHLKALTEGLGGIGFPGSGMTNGVGRKRDEL
ncbi:hypothetical protein AJ79_03247 [Helicocarpus griseus UAMH5409]|uniref:chitinase n=1 Tax=Helicocarpus griseus UAMH5409 TaxID=1447875 RepID=A0A2B7XYN3_9EURO|nr:hypothetical protein AJ79_03247 [Helicocarpus griseus UAMH5409]